MGRTEAKGRAQARNGLVVVANRPEPESTDLQERTADRESNGKLSASLATEMRGVLAQLEMLSHGKTQSFNASARGEVDDPRPFGEQHPPHEEFRARWLNAPAEKRPDVLREARSELQAWRVFAGGPVNEETWEELAKRIVKKGDGWEVQAVANALNVSTGQVRRARREHGMDQETGKPKVDVVRLSREHKLSVRQIAARTGIPRSTVQDVLKKAA